MRFVSALLILILTLSSAMPDAYATNKKKKAPAGNPKYASIVVDAETGVILSQRNADKSLHPASLVKIMTLLMAFEALDAKQITLRDRMPVSTRATQMSPSKIDVSAGSTLRVEDGIYALVTKSANDVAVVMAEYLGGTESRFAQLMTQRARDIGMKNTIFKNASGLPNPAQVTTARDMATLARYILVRYPHYYHYFSTKQFTYRGKTHGNHNRLLHSYPGMDGFKTGYINASGFNLVASAKRNGQRLIGVVFGGQTSKTRNDHMVKIMNEGFVKARNLKDVQVAAVAQTPQQKAQATQQAEEEARELAQVKTLMAQQAAKNAAGGQPIPPQKPINSNARPDSRFGSDGASYTSLSSLSETRTVPSASSLAQNMTSDDRINTVKNSMEHGYMEELAGQGDYDVMASKRLETGLLAVAVHKGQYRPNPNPASSAQNSMRAAGHAMIAKMANSAQPPTPPASTSLPAAPADQNWQTIYSGQGWAIQIGAYNSKLATDQALRDAMAKLPPDIAQKAKPVSVPLRTESGIMFRARLSGLTNAQAFKACGYFSDCLTLSPQKP